jgi:hypothetical protein
MSKRCCVRWLTGIDREPMMAKTNSHPDGGTLSSLGTIDASKE